MKTIRTLLIAIIFTALASMANAQSVGINSDGSAPHGSAMLDVKSANKGLLIPNVALTGTTDAVTIATPAVSLLVYNTATAGTAPNNVTPGYYYNSVTSGSPLWTKIGAASGASQWATGGSNIYYNTGNVGIGTDAPNNKLQIGSTTYSVNSLAMGNGTQNFAIDISARTIPTFFSDNNFSFMASGGTGNVGIGTSTPASKLHIAGADMNNALLFENTSANPGRNYMLFKTQGTEQGYIGLGGGATNHMSVAAYGASNNIYLETNDLVRMTILPSGNIGIGTITPSHPLQMASGAHVTAAGVWTNASDARLKTNVVNTPYGLSTVMKLRPVNYTMVKGGEAQVGFLAQEVQKIVPEVVSGTEGDITKGETLGLSYGNLVPVLTKAIQEQQATIEAQQKQIDELKAQNTALAGELKAEIETLKKAIYGSSVVVRSEK